MWIKTTGMEVSLEIEGTIYLKHALQKEDVKRGLDEGSVFSKRLKSKFPELF